MTFIQKVLTFLSLLKYILFEANLPGPQFTLLEKFHLYNYHVTGKLSNDETHCLAIYFISNISTL